MLALLQPGDTIPGTWTWPPAATSTPRGSGLPSSGKWFNAVQYGVRADDGCIDYDQLEKLALEHRPRLIIAGASAYSRIIDFARFRGVADEVGGYLHGRHGPYRGPRGRGPAPLALPARAR